MKSFVLVLLGHWWWVSWERVANWHLAWGLCYAWRLVWIARDRGFLGKWRWLCFLRLGLCNWRVEYHWDLTRGFLNALGLFRNLKCRCFRELILVFWILWQRELFFFRVCSNYLISLLFNHAFCALACFLNLFLLRLFWEEPSRSLLRLLALSHSRLPPTFVHFDTLLALLLLHFVSFLLINGTIRLLIINCNLLGFILFIVN